MANGFAFGVGSCHCGCDTTDHCVVVEWDIEILDFNDLTTWIPSSGSIVVWMPVADPPVGYITCESGVAQDPPITMAPDYDYGGGPQNLKVIAPENMCGAFRFIQTSDVCRADAEWPEAYLDGTYYEYSEDTDPCTGGSAGVLVTVRGYVTVTNTFPASEGSCDCGAGP